MRKVFLSLLLCLIFAAPAYGATVFGDWAEPFIEKANVQGIIPTEYYMENYTMPVNREVVAQITANSYINNFDFTFNKNDRPFDDTNSLYVAAVYKLGIINGRGDKIFDPYTEVTREEMAKIVLFYKSACDNLLYNLEDSDVDIFTDGDEISDWAKPYVKLANELGVIKGFEDGTFRPKESVSLEQVFVMLQRAFPMQEREKPEISGLEQDSIVTKDVRLNINASGKYRLYAKEFNGGYVKLLGEFSANQDCTLDFDMLKSNSVYDIYVESERVFSEPIRIYTNSYNLIADINDFVETDTVVIDWCRLPDVTSYEVTITETRTGRHEMPENIPIEYVLSQNEKITLQVNPCKKYHVVISGGGLVCEKEFYTGSKAFEDKDEIYSTYPQNEEDAKKMMKTVKVPIWKLNGNKKVSSYTYITVHNAIADKVEKIFEEIYNGPEKFPIKDIGGYNWRGGVTEHNGGTAIDINYDENYCIYSNGTTIGSFWKPFENPYSITPYGDVVKAFEKYGFTWGADSWSNPRDFMHFSYLGT